MTEGTSQGLFIVVAIVIFGIFVSLSYTLFGNILTPSMEGIFLDATHQATSKMNGYEYLDIELLPATRAHLNHIAFDYNRYHVEDGSRMWSFIGQLGIKNPDTGVYEIPYYITRNDGRLTGILDLNRLYAEINYDGEPEYNIVSSKVFINGREVPTNFGISSSSSGGVRYQGIMPSGYDLELDKVYDIELYLITDNKEVFVFPKSILIESTTNSELIH